MFKSIAKTVFLFTLITPLIACGSSATDITSVPTSPTATPPTATPTDVPPTEAPPTVAPEPTNTPVPPIATATPTPDPGDTMTRPADGMIMVYVPAGQFEMGSDDDGVDDAMQLCSELSDDCQRRWYENQQPAHTVTLDKFWIDKYEVSNAQYQKCVEAGECQAPTRCNWGQPTYGKADKADHPAVCVDWQGAQDYCQWAGGRLPTEAEWEYAARGPAANVFPWGDTFDGTLANSCDTNCTQDWRYTGYDDGYEQTAPVGSYPDGASWCGTEDMAGNVWEWVSDWYDSDYYRVSPAENPGGPSSGEHRVARGGSWRDGSNGELLLAAFRYYPGVPSIRTSNGGFRCASAIRLVPAEPETNEVYLEVFEVVWHTVDETYFDPEFGGLDWDAVHDEYEPMIAAAQDDEAFYQILNQMLWQLNVSHTGVGPGDMWQSVEPVAFARAEIGIDVRLLDGQAVITRVEAGSPAEEAGLQPGFIIQGIDGVTVEQILAEAEGHLAPPYNEQGHIDGLTRCLLALIYGEPETSVTLTYLDEHDEIHERAIERSQRQRPAPMVGTPLPTSYLEFTSERLENGIGVIRFNTFHPILIPDIVEAVATLQDAPGIIIDLRGNPGGELTTGKRLAGQFLDRETSFGHFITREGTEEMIITGEGVYAGPVVILIDASSYSCSEWLAAGMQAAGRAVIIGERSPGGATGMNAMTLPNGASLGYPVIQVLAPDGTVLEGHGVIPDVAVSLDRAQLLAGIDAQLKVGIDYILDNTE